jgi:hypothetical protein
MFEMCSRIATMSNPERKGGSVCPDALDGSGRCGSQPGFAVSVAQGVLKVRTLGVQTCSRKIAKNVDRRSCGEALANVGCWTC